MRVAAYVYSGWHPIPERDASFHPGFTEWELVESCRPRFPGHPQPRLPRDGAYDDRDPVACATRMRLAQAHGVDALIHGVFWCRGKRVFEQALDGGYLGSEVGREMPFAVMWANRMPRRVLPVRNTGAVIDPARRVRSDVEDFRAFVEMLATRYFHRDNYVRIEGRSYLSIFDSTFFVKELGPEGAAAAIAGARRWLRESGYPDLHLAAVEPNSDCIGLARDIGFDSVTHYVLLPDWKGPLEQDYAEYARLRADQWAGFGAAAGLPYMPAVSPGWDASPRAADFGPERPSKYPWSPVVTGEHPDRFAEALERAVRFSPATGVDDPLVLVSSLNEWSEGHYLEPDQRFGTGWLEAVRAAR